MNASAAMLLNTSKPYFVQTECLSCGLRVRSIARQDEDGNLSIQILGFLCDCDRRAVESDLSWKAQLLMRPRGRA